MRPIQEAERRPPSRATRAFWSRFVTSLKKVTFWISFKNPAVLSFEGLYRRESQQLLDEPGHDRVRVVKGPADEPWVAFTPKDRFGIALSGGGIRSATFNLGLLGSLAELGVLKRLHYLSTVSGGGYVGGFWSAWLRRRRRANHAVFPLDGDGGRGERAEVRHLREFSRFLLPRMGISETEFWELFMIVLGGLLPSLLAALAALAVAWGAWAAIVLPVADHDISTALLLVLVYFSLTEIVWRRTGKRERRRDWEPVGYGAGCLLALALLLVGHRTSTLWMPAANLLFGKLYSVPPPTLIPSLLLCASTLLLLFLRSAGTRFFRTTRSVPFFVGCERAVTRVLALASAFVSLALLWELAGLLLRMTKWTTSVSVLAGGATLSSALFAWVRKWLSQPPEETRGATLLHSALGWLKRQSPKLIALIAWVLLFELVALAVRATYTLGHAGYRSPFGILIIASVSVLGLTVWLFDPARVGLHEFYRSRISRCYLGASNLRATEKGTENWRAAQANRYTSERADDDLYLRELPGSSFLSPSDVLDGSLVKRLQDHQDPVSTYIWERLRRRTQRLLMQATAHDIETSSPSSVSLATALATAINKLLEDPAFGDHVFAHIHPEQTRPACATGSANDCVRINRALLEDAGIVAPAPRLPIHLVCTAANDMSGDRVGTLYRGARSAVLSVNGISLGDETAPLEELRLSSALTASAAAFNSQMGRISIDLGPAVTFLMSALNLRLGLWVPHPAYRPRTNYTLPGRFFLYELFGRSRTDRRHLLLSDGNHFENFGLYELIRRHCRHIIVSDCGADAEVAFDDLANVIRRVREDFGVEIDLDITPLRPGPGGLSGQHAVVGTVHYNGLNGLDKGAIIYFKPSMTGDEPPDVLQYRTRNRSFPHETTGDQFYDEPQWESYRRLGEHAGRSVFGCLHGILDREAPSIDPVFRDARIRWQPAPVRQNENFLAMTQRCVELETDLSAKGPVPFRAEFYQEVPALRFPSASQSPSKPSLEDELAIVSFLMRVLQIMEDVWLAADLDNYWSHPLNEGWMSYFQRWAATPSFRRWWPILSPTYSTGFRSFAKSRFHVGLAERLDGAGAQLAISEVTDRDAFVAEPLWRQFLHGHPSSRPDAARILQYDLRLLGYEGTLDERAVPVGFVLVHEASPIASWNAEECWVPPMLQGAGIISGLLDDLLDHYSSRGFTTFNVTVGAVTAGGTQARPKAIGLAERLERVRAIEFYKSREFEYVQPEDGATGQVVLTRGAASGPNLGKTDGMAAIAQLRTMIRTLPRHRSGDSTPTSGSQTKTLEAGPAPVPDPNGSS